MTTRIVPFISANALPSEESIPVTGSGERDFPKLLNHAAKAEIGRVAYNIFFSKPGKSGKTILFCGTGDTSHSSDWIAIHMGQFLAMRGKAARVLCVGEHRPGAGFRPDSDGRNEGRRESSVVLSDRCQIEWISSSGQATDVTRALIEHLIDSRERGENTLVHVENLNRFPEILSFAEKFDGAALIVRASKTRKAALAAAREQLAAADLPMLGGILIDQTYPIPEKLYRAL